MSERIEDINQKLRDYFGIETVSDRPIFRIVWADDQTEMRLTDRLDSGIQLLHPVVREVKKYPYLKGLYVLERLVVVPEFDRNELAGIKTSYEPIWAYFKANGEPVPPMWSATKFVVDTLFAALGKKSMAKYVDDEINTTPEGRELRITKLTQELFGNESDTGDALAYKEGVVVPSNYQQG